MTQIPHVIITIVLNEKYSATESTRDLLSFESGDLGQTTKIGVTVAKNSASYQSKLNTASKGVNITPATPFPATGAEIPPVTITIELNETYIANSGTESLLSFDSNPLGKT